MYVDPGFNAKAAGEKLVKHSKGRHPRRPSAFSRDKYLKEQDHGSVKDRPIPGRRRKVPEELAT